MAALLAVGVALLAAMGAYATGLPWQVAVFITWPLVASCAYAACHTRRRRDPR